MNQLLLTFNGPSKCPIHNCDAIYVLREWFCPKCENDPNKTPRHDYKGMDGEDGFQIIDLDLDWLDKKGK